MTKDELIEILSDNRIPNDAVIMSDSGWECDPTDIGGIWYNKDKNLVVLTQGGDFELKTYRAYTKKKIEQLKHCSYEYCKGKGWEMIYCKK